MKKNVSEKDLVFFSFSNENQVLSFFFSSFFSSLLTTDWKSRRKIYNENNFEASVSQWKSVIKIPPSNEIKGKDKKKIWNLTWHCCGPPCRVGDAVFGLCFFVGVDETAAGKLEFDEGVTVVARVVIVSGCWVETTIEAGDDDNFCEICEMLDDDATVSITLATENKLSCLKCVGFTFFTPSSRGFTFNFHYFNRSLYLYLHERHVSWNSGKISASALLITLLCEGAILVRQ